MYLFCGINPRIAVGHVLLSTHHKQTLMYVNIEATTNVLHMGLSDGKVPQPTHSEVFRGFTVMSE